MKKSKAPVRQRTYDSILFSLNSILSGKKYPDLIIGELFRMNDLSPDEKTVLFEFVYGILRHLGRLDHIIEHASRARMMDLDPEVLNSIRICTYQAVFTDASAAGILNNAEALQTHNKRFTGFVKRTVGSILKNKDKIVFPDRENAPAGYIAAYHSHPRWIVEKWIKETGSVEVVEALCMADNIEPPLTIRVNPLKTDTGSFQNALDKEGYSSSGTGSQFSLIVNRKIDIFKTNAFKEGLFEVQDEGSQLVTMLTGAKPGELVIDACAGNGGKTLFLSGLMNNRGTIIASDISQAKLLNLRKRAKKAGAFNIMTVETGALKEYYHKADCVFIDAPCSGMGVFRRNPDSKWHLTENDIAELCAKQKEIIRQYCVLVKPGGRLVYATCTLSREENEGIVLGFLEEMKDFYLIPAAEMNPSILGRFMTEEGYFRSLPHIHNTDGFFGAVVRRIA